MYQNMKQMEIFISFRLSKHMLPLPYCIFEHLCLGATSSR